MYKFSLFQRLMNMKFDNMQSKDQVKMHTMNLPFELGEFTGNYVDSTDRTLAEAIIISGNLTHEKSTSSFKENISVCVGTKGHHVLGQHFTLD